MQVRLIRMLQAAQPHQFSLSAFFAAKKLDEVTAWDIERYKREAADEIGNSTVNRRLVGLSHMLNQAVKAGIVDRSPSQGVKLFREEEKVQIRASYPGEQGSRSEFPHCNRNQWPTSPEYAPSGFSRLGQLTSQANHFLRFNTVLFIVDICPERYMLRAPYPKQLTS